MDKRRSLLCGVLCWLACAVCLVRGDEPRLPARDTVLAGLRLEHPRLLASAADFERLKTQCRDHAAVKEWCDRLQADAEELLTAPPVKYEIPDGKRLLSVCRRAKDRVLLLGLVYRLTGDPRFARRCWHELDTVTRFRDWNPTHFLDTAEMTFAVSIGYDWLYATWNQDQRQQLRRAIVDLGLRPGLPIYREHAWWSQAVHNWNQVCNGGMAIGALAVADEEPELAAEVLHAALQSLPLAMHEFRPDGGWGEGPGYWRYATEYNVFFLAGLRTGLGTDFGLAELPGFSVTGDFPVHFVGPTGLSFNYADARADWRGAPQLFWLASTFDQPVYAAAQLPHAAARLSALDLLWGARWLEEPPQKNELPRDRRFDGVAVVTLRSGWNDPSAIFVGCKGGDNRVNHGQLDLGSFVLDALGQRWAIDLGPDDYNLPGYFGKQRWTYYRNRTEGHNTLVINGQNQSTSAQAAVVQFDSNAAQASAVFDLSAAYPDATRVQRGVALLDRERVLVQDEVTADREVDVAWNLHTEADVVVTGTQAELTLDGDRLRLQILSPPDARLSVHDVRVEPPQRPIHGVRRLVLTPGERTRELRIVVLLTPDSRDARPLPTVRPLEQWPGGDAAP